MGMQLNIKSDDAYAMASELAELTGESLTAAVTTAIRERLERERKARDREERWKDVERLCTELRAHLQPPYSSSDPDEFYDEDGLPR